MKKIISLFVALFVSGLLFAADIYTVKEVKGKVTYEVSAGKFKDVVEGQELSVSTVINVGVNSNLILEADGKTYTIKPMSKGALNSFVSASVASGFKKNPDMSMKSIADATSTTGKGISTASERGSGKGEEELELDE